MRNDFDALLCERPRYNNPYHKERHSDRLQFDHDEEDVELHESVINLHRNRKSKDLNEYLAPLKRFLHSRVGRSWNRVYSEIRKNFSPNGAVTGHIYQHLFDYVELNCYTEDGKVFKSNGTELRSWQSFYVDQTGLLKKTKQTVYKSVYPSVLFKNIGLNQWLVQRKDITGHFILTLQTVEDAAKEIFRKQGYFPFVLGFSGSPYKPDGTLYEAYRKALHSSIMTQAGDVIGINRDFAPDYAFLSLKQASKKTVTKLLLKE